MLPSASSTSTSFYRYRAWDGSQAVTPLTPEELLATLGDALLSGSIEQALDKALHRGSTNADGESLTGLDQLRDHLRAERRQLAESPEMQDALRRLAEQLRAGQAGGNKDTALDPDSSRLLEALAASANARQLLDAVDAASRGTIETALGAHSGATGRDDSDLTSSTTFHGSSTHAAHAARRLETLDALERQLRRVRRVEDVGEVDPETVRAALGDGPAEGFERLAASLHAFAGSGYIRQAGRRLELSGRALQRLGDELLSDVFRQLAARGAGDHFQQGTHSGHDLSGVSRPYSFGDPLTLDLSRTVLDAVRRGVGVPVRIDARDFAIFEREETSRAATVLAIDLSRSMGERGYLLAAKKLALALATLVRMRFPRDRLLLAGFSERARTLSTAEIPLLTWDRYGFGTNIQDGLRLGRALLAPHRGLQRTIVLITDGEPTAHRDASGTVHFKHPPAPETLAETYAEAERCRRDGIALAVCVLSDQLQVVRFAEELARRAAGRLLVAAPDNLAATVTLHYGRSRNR